AAPTHGRRGLAEPGVLQPRRPDLPQPAQGPLPQAAQGTVRRRGPEPDPATPPRPTRAGSTDDTALAHPGAQRRAGVPRLHANGIPGQGRARGPAGHGTGLPTSPGLRRPGPLSTLDMPTH